MFWLPGVEFELARLVLERGVKLLLSIVFAFGLAEFAFGVRLALADLFEFVLLFELLLFELVFLFLGGFGLFSFSLLEVFVFLFSGSTGFTVSEASPSFAARLMSIATVCPALTTSPGRGS